MISYHIICFSGCPPSVLPAGCAQRLLNAYMDEFDIAQIADLQPKFANCHSRRGGEGTASFSTTEASVAAKVWIGRRTRELCTSGVCVCVW